MDINRAKNQRESFESAATSDDSFMTASEGLIVMRSGRSHSGDAPHRLGTPHSEAQTVHSGSNNKNYIIQDNR